MPARGALLVDLTGRVFGRLTVVSFAERVNRRSLWLCECSCGSTKVVGGKVLQNGETQSCGCIQRQFAAKLARSRATHGHAGARRSPTYVSWRAMISRCRGVGSEIDRRNYRDRGITVAEHWHSFENFLADMGERPPGTSLDRIDNNGNYEPDNCRWATPKQQIANQRPGVVRGRRLGAKDKRPRKRRGERAA